MGWEILHDDKRNYAVFFCNTDDKPIGNLFSTGYGFHKQSYYAWFQQRNLDPRTMTEESLQQEIEILQMLEEEPEIKAIIPLSQGKKRIVSALIDSFNHKVSFPYSDDYDEEDIDYQEEAEEYINDQIKNLNFCGEHGELKWCITSINTSKGRQTVDEAKHFPESVPIGINLLDSCVGLAKS
jgi:hypothetical protein